MHRFVAIPLCFLATMIFISGDAPANDPPSAPGLGPILAKEIENPVRAKYLITVADDFIVDVYHNGKCVPISKRTLLREIHGATAERIDIEVKKGDWLVFNVVNNRLRWGGVSYFGAAGCLMENEFGFVSRLDDGLWSVCDSPRDADRFIANKTYLRHRAAQEVRQPWEYGNSLMHELAGSSWQGASVWGNSRNTWIKVIAED